jgi:hypothetical protein
MANDLDNDMQAAAQNASGGPTTHLVVKQRDPDRRPLLVDKTMFSRMQATQRRANARKNFPNMDLALLTTAALRIVFELPNADQMIIKQTLQDLAAATDEFPASPVGAADS